MRFEIQIKSKPAIVGRTLPDAIGFVAFWPWKKKPSSFIIPPDFYKEVSQSQSVAQVSEPEAKAEAPVQKQESTVSSLIQNVGNAPQNPPNRYNPLSLKAVGIRKDIENQLSGQEKPLDDYAHESFTELEMQLMWSKFAKNLENKGEMLLNALMSMSIPTLNGTTILHELPNEGTRIEFREKLEQQLLRYLRGNLHNHDIEIKIVVNEKIEEQKAFTIEDKYQKLVQINPMLEDFRRFFELDL